jgi:hypothetical protein
VCFVWKNLGIFFVFLDVCERSAMADFVTLLKHTV